MHRAHLILILAVEYERRELEHLRKQVQMLTQTLEQQQNLHKRTKGEVESQGPVYGAIGFTLGLALGAVVVGLLL